MAGVIATERIFEKLPITNAQERTRKVLRFAPGQVVPDEEAERLGVSADGTQADVPTADTDVSGHVPLVSRTSLVTAEAAPVAGTETTTVAAPEGPQKQAAPKVTTTTTSDAPAKKAPAKRAAKKA